jgi:hypothetical protein
MAAHHPSAGFDVRAASDVSRALGYAHDTAPQCLRARYQGLDLFRLTQPHGSTLPTILTTGYPIEMIAVDQVELDLQCIQKPFDFEQLPTGSSLI